MSWLVFGENLNDDIRTALDAHDLGHLHKTVLDALDRAGVFDKTWAESDE